jgi:phosphoribosylamine---glycine ligase
MNILLLGSGGREHAFAWKMKQSALCQKLLIAPGNAGTAALGTNLPIGVNDFAAIRSVCVQEKIDMLVVGPEDPLVNGIVDFFAADADLQKLMVIGPDKFAAQLEGSKAFAKAFMQRHQIPTAAYAAFDSQNFEAGIAYLQAHSLPIVLKADGLAAGKGVVICATHQEAIVEFTAMIKAQKFGAASAKVVVEQFLNGIELSVFALTDGKNFVLLPEAKDYKRIGEGDKGLNTGGMGAVSPVPFANDVFRQKVLDKIIRPTIEGLQKEKMHYHGFVFFGLIKVGEEPMVIEYNCRMGDPETEVVLPRLKTDLVQLFWQLKNNALPTTVAVDERHACTVVAVSGGYPGDYAKGLPIAGLDQATDSIIFHAGTVLKDGAVLTNGGRVLAVTSFGNDVQTCVAQSKACLQQIEYAGLYYRKDIGYEFI